MGRTRSVLICLAGLTVVPVVTGAQEPPARATPAKPEAAAIVCLLEGEVTATGPDAKEAVELELLDVLPDGTRVAASAGGWAVLGFADGRRVRLEESSEALVTPAGLELVAGAATPLPPVPALAKLAPVVLGARSRRVATYRPRSLASPGVLEVRPPQGALVLPGVTTVELNQPCGSGPWTITVRDATGHAVHRAEAAGPSAVIPEGVLEPGQSYYWTLQAREPCPRSSTPGAVLTTLDADALAARDVLAASIESSHDPATAVLLAGFDYVLWRDDLACRRLHVASEEGAGRTSIARLEKRMSCRAGPVVADAAVRPAP